MFNFQCSPKNSCSPGFMSAPTPEKIKTLARKHFALVQQTRHHLHAHPELSFEEVNTSAYIASVLTQHGITFQQGIVNTGIVALVHGKNPGKKTIALRGDLDALPIEEKSTAAYASQNKGVMHACGHDVHASCLLGAAIVLHELRNEFEGTVKFIFQPGEEKLPGGASLMIKAGVLENPAPASIYAQHVFPSLPAGKVGFRSGMYMASTDELYVKVKGKGGHAAMPADYINPILVTARILSELDRLFMRDKTFNSTVPTVLAFGRIEGYGATNVIPDEVNVQGTFRTFDETWRAEAHAHMISNAERIAAEMNATCVFDVQHGYPFLVNDETVTAAARTAAENYLGKENVVTLDMRMTAEDFAFFSQHLPACFYRLGTASPDGRFTAGVHTAVFDIDETALETGTGLLAWIALNGLAE